MANYSEMTHAQLVAICSKQQEELDEYRHICNCRILYTGKRHTPKDLSIWIDKQVEKIEDLEYDLKEAEDYRDDLEDLQADLSELDVYKDGLTGVCDYNDVVCYIKARLEEIKELKEQLKEPSCLFLYKAKVKELRDEIDELKEASVPKEILFAERRGLKEQISDLKEKYDELYELHYK